MIFEPPVLEMTEEGVRVVEDCTEAEIHQQVFIQNLFWLLSGSQLGPLELSAADSEPGTAGSQSKESVKSFHLRFCTRGGKWKIKRNVVFVKIKLKHIVDM